MGVRTRCMKNPPPITPTKTSKPAARKAKAAPAKSATAARKSAAKKAASPRKAAPAKRATPAKKSAARPAAKRELIDTGTDKRFVRRGEAGKFKESDDVGRSLAQDVRKRAKTVAPSGQGDRGDHAASGKGKSRK